MEELYINDKRIDLGDATVTLNHKSNFNGDLSTIQASNSQTIKLPKTENNRAALDCPDIPSRPGAYLRKYNDARFYRNGIELFRGFAVLLSSGEEFEICLSWGTLSALTEFLNQDDALNEYLDDGTFIQWGQNTYKDDQYGGYYLNSRDETWHDMPNHPSVYVSDILARIQSKSGLVFKFPDGITAWLADKKVPCIGRENSKKFIGNRAEIFTIASFEDLGDEYLTTYRIILHSDNAGYAVTHDNAKENAYIITVGDGLTSLDMDIKIMGRAENGIFSRFQVWDGALDGGGAPALVAYGDFLTSGDSFSLFTKLSIPNPSGSYYFYIIGIPRDYTLTQNEISMTVTFADDKGGYGEVPYPGYYSVFINLPDINLKDFMKDIAALTGTFPNRSPKDPANQITFSPFDILYDNKAKAVDWSDKLMYKGAPQEMEYQYGDMAQRNYLQYEESEETPVSRGVITVHDDTLEREAELYTLSFAATETATGGVAVIHLYDKDNDGAWEHTDTEPRICSTFQDTAKNTYLGFAGMGFPDIVASRYTGYQRIFGQPVVLREDFRLTEIDLRDVDFTVPVYLRQYGRFYAIIQIQDTNGICKVELLQLN